MLIRTTIILLIAVAAQDALIAQSDERWRVPDSALAIAASELDSAGGMASAALSFLRSAGSCKLVALRKFGKIAAFSAPTHLSPCRFHKVGKSILEQLRGIGPEDIGRARGVALAASGAAPEALPSVALTQQNVVANYLLHHLVALHLADHAGKTPDRRSVLLESALVYEARAQGFLVDAFSPGHMRVPMGGILPSLHTVNTEEAHSFYNSQGLFVINSRGEVWQAFGDQLTQWYAPTWEHVLEACCTSVRELFLVYSYREDSLTIPVPLLKGLGFIPHAWNIGASVKSWLVVEPGDFYYTQVMLPTLTMIPFPESATWSVRSGQKDTHGMRIRRHYPQIRDDETEVGFSDSTLMGPSLELLCPWDALPPWMLPDAWLPRQYVGNQRIRDIPPSQKHALESLLIKSDSNVTSVRFIQELNYPPSYSGLIVSLGGGGMWENGSPAGMVAGSVGYAPRWGFLPDLLTKFRLSGSISLLGSLDGSDRLLVSGRVGFTLPFSLVGLGPEWPAGNNYGIRLEAGYTEGLRSLLDSHGAVVSLCFETVIIPLGFTYVGVVIRPRIDVHFLQSRISTIMLEVVII
jgi:hypothetical protein